MKAKSLARKVCTC